MAVYKPTYCYPYLESVDLTIPDGEKYFTCQIDTSNIKITGYRVELYNENNEKVFPLNEGKISPLSELNDTDGTLGLNGSELRFPFVQHWNSKIYPSYNAIYFKATNYVDYYQSESFDNTNMIISNGQLYYTKDGKPTSDPVVVDGSFIFVGDSILIGQDFYTITLDGLGDKTGSLTQSSIVYVKGGDSNAGKILQYTDGTFGESSSGAWCDVSGNPLAISNNGKTYKWQITLYSGERGATRTTNEANGAVEIDYSAMADNEFNTVLTSGTILGSTEDRIQGPISDKIYAKQWLQLLKKNDENKWVQVGIRTYIESYSQTLGCIYPISGDSRGFDNDDLYGTDPATHFAVYKYSNDPNFITSQNSVDQSVNFALTEQGMTYNAGSYSYEIVGRDKIDAFNDYCKGKNPEKLVTTPLCEYKYNEDDDTYEPEHAGESVLIWNKENSKSNDLTGYFTISFSTSKGEDGKKIPKFVFDMAYSYRKVSSYIGKVFFVKGGSFANENIVSKAEATGENDVISLGSPITFTQEEPLEIYPKKFYGEIFKNSVKNGVGTVYVSPFVGLQAGARLYVSDGTVIKAKTVDTTAWAVTYNPKSPASTAPYSSTNPLKYEIRTNFKSSDETLFYAYDSPRLVPWSEQALSVIGTNGYEFLLEFLGQVLTVPTVFSSEIHARYVHVTGQYLQAQNISWTSYRWLLVDEYGQVIQDTGKQYDGLIETTFYGLNGPTMDAVEKGKAVPTTYYPVLIVEDELGNSLIMGMEIKVSLNPRNLPMEFSGGFDCKTQSVIMKITDYGYPKFSQDSNNKAIVLSTSEGVSYQITEEDSGGAQIPANPIEVGDTLTELYFDTTKTPDFSKFDWDNPTYSSGRFKGISFIDFTIGGITYDLLAIILSEDDFTTKGYSINLKQKSTTDLGNVLSTFYADYSELGFDPSRYGYEKWGWQAEKYLPESSASVDALNHQDIWGEYISKDGQWKSGGSKVVSGEVKILGLDQQGKLSSLAANQVKIPLEGAQLKHFFAKDTTEIPDLSKAPKKLATNDKGNIEFHTKVKLDANFCGEILKYSVDIFDVFGNTDKLNISLELPNNFTGSDYTKENLNSNRNFVNCVVSTSNGGKKASAAGMRLFTLNENLNTDGEAYYLQPEDWIDGNGDIKDSNKQKLEYLDFVHPFDTSNTELTNYTNINEPINIKEDKNSVSRDVGVCCLQQVNATTGNNLFNKWTDLKRVKIQTPAGYRVVQTTEPAVWQDTINDNPNIWTEGWNNDYDTEMVQVKRHAEVAQFTWEINGYLREIDALCGQSLKVTASFDGVWKVYKETQYKDGNLIEGEEPYVTIQMKEEA
nr:MAG TPA: hypothetical protein [Caudoviricetes sp.]